MDDKNLQKAREIALRRLNRRESSSTEMRNHLLCKGFEQNGVDVIVAELISKKYIDDDRYTRMLIRYQATSGKGPHWIRKKLLEKGIKKDLSEIQTILSEVFDLNQPEQIQTWLDRRFPNGFDNQRNFHRALQALQRKGFSFEVIYRVLKEHDARHSSVSGKL